MPYVIDVYNNGVLFFTDSGYIPVRSRLWPHQLRTVARLCRDYTGDSSVIVADDEVGMLRLIDRPG